MTQPSLGRQSFSDEWTLNLVLLLLFLNKLLGWLILVGFSMSANIVTQNLKASRKEIAQLSAHLNSIISSLSSLSSCLDLDSSYLDRIKRLT